MKQSGVSGMDLESQMSKSCWDWELEGFQSSPGKGSDLLWRNTNVLQDVTDRDKENSLVRSSDRRKGSEEKRGDDQKLRAYVDQLERELLAERLKVKRTQEALDVEKSVRSSLQRQIVTGMNSYTTSVDGQLLQERIQDLTKENQKLKFDLCEERRRSSKAMEHLRKLMRLAKSS